MKDSSATTPPATPAAVAATKAPEPAKGNLYTIV